MPSGFTPRKRYSAAHTASAALPTTSQPSSAPSASALAGVRLNSTTCSGPIDRHAARASAPPIFPTPIKAAFFMNIPRF